MPKSSGKNGRPLTEDEQKLWQHIAQTIQPLSRLPGAPTTSHKSAARIHLPPAPPPIHKPLTNPIENRSDRKTRRGQLHVDSLIDLHDLTRDAAFDRLKRHLHRAQTRGHKCVLVITGKGKAGQGILRQSLPGWLHDPALRPLIAAQAQAHIRHGGGGAFYVFLKRKK